MSLNPLNELKRRLDDDDAPLPKRLCLARNVVQSHHFPTAPKERIVAEWLSNLAGRNEMSSKEMAGVIGWLNAVDDLTGELKSELIKVIFQYLQRNPVNDADIQHILTFLENPKISTQLTLHIDEYLYIVVTLLQHLHLRQNEGSDNTQLCNRILSNLITYYKESKKKLEFIIKLLEGVNLETVFSFLNTECHSAVIKVCQTVLFPMNKKSFFVSFLQTLLRKDNIDDLIAEKGDNIQSVLKIMSAFFTFPKGRTEKSATFLADFITVFVSCFKNESQLIFAFYIMVVNSLNMEQSYIAPAMKMPPIIFEENDEKTKRSLFLQMLEILLVNEVDISVRLTDTIGEKVSKVEIKKNFTSFLQTVMMGQLKLEGKLDKITLKIIKVALKLDPILIEEKLDQILPPIMIAKKANSTLMESYVEMLNCLLEILFKVSQGTIFINRILPHVKLCLEACNTEQFELKQKLKEATENGIDPEKLKNKVITGNDIFPTECVRMYGKCTSELLFRQNKELLVSLRKDFEEHCLMMLEEGFVSPSIITLAEVLSAILSSFLRHSKMADHTIPRQISEEFWASFEAFEKDCLGKFGECVLKLSYNSTLTQAFLNLCLHFAQLKLLNAKYCNTKIDIQPYTSEVLDLSPILPCLDRKQWIALAERADNEAAFILENLLVLKITTMELLSIKSQDGGLTQNVLDTKTHLIQRLNINPNILISNDCAKKVLFSDLERGQIRILVKSLVKLYLSSPDIELFKSEGILKNRSLLNALVLEVDKNISKCFENTEDLCKAMSKGDFDLISFVKEKDMEDYLNQISLKENHEEIIQNCIELLKNLPVAYLEETCQLTTILVLLFSKMHCSKKTCKKIDHILQNLFELSPKYPDLYKIFTVKFMFSFKENSLLDLMTLKIKTSNNMLPIKCLIESAAKKVKTDSKIITEIVEIVLKKQKNKKDNVTCMEYFSNPVFQISCIALPIIAKEKKAITTSNYRSILANLQEKLHKSMLEAFRMIDFSTDSSLSVLNSGNHDDSMVVSENTLAILNAMGAYSLTLSKYCETTDAEEIKNLDCLWSGLEFFIQNAIQAIQNPSSKIQHVDLSIQLLNIVLRYIKKLTTHPMFQKPDNILIQIWKSVISRLSIIYGIEDRKWIGCLEYMVITMKFLCELISVEAFVGTFVKDLSVLCELKKPSEIISSETIPSSLSSHKTAKYLLTQCLKANIVGPKCNALSKLIYQYCKALRFWVQQNYELNQERVEKRKAKGDFAQNEEDFMQDEVKVVAVDDKVCELLRVDLDLLSEAIMAGKKISLDYKSLDAVFELQHMVHYLLGQSTTNLKCELSWTSFLKLHEGCIMVLNNLLMAREELLEDRWPCYMQCYRALVSLLCVKASADGQREKMVDEKLAEIAHSVEKLTQSICKRKTHVSRIAAYTVADLCSLIETNGPSRMFRNHLENSISLLLQASDSSYSVAFLRRALAGSPGHMTLTNMYTMYKRYHKYVGNA